MERASKIWMDGALVDWSEATLHVVSNSFQYGFNAFEGIRVYATAAGSAVFRLDAHIDRLLNSAKILGLKVPYGRDDIMRACCDTVAANGFEECYIRPIVYIGYGGMGLDYRSCDVNVAIAVWQWGEYLGAGRLAKGSRIRTSSHVRHHINSHMTKAKAGGNYMLFQMTRTEALRDGYDEALLLDQNGNVAEGSVENIFVVRRGELVTPPTTYLLEGITRDSIIRIARDTGYVVREEFFPRDVVYISDEAFFCGTGAEVTPVVEVDDRPIGDGSPGPITKRLQELFFNAVHGRDERYRGWLTHVGVEGAGQAGVRSKGAA